MPDPSESRNPASNGHRLLGLGQNFYVDAVAVGLFAVIYLLGVLWLARHSVLFAIALFIIAPLLWLATQSPALHHKRTRFLLMAQTCFMTTGLAIIVMNRFDIAYPQFIAEGGFALYFIVQIFGFIRYQIFRKSVLGAMQSSIMGILLFSWWHSLDEYYSVTGDSGLLLIWGVEAPIQVQIGYAVVMIQVLLVDSIFPPKMTQTVVHVASIGISLSLGAFFYTRVLTAMHLFLLDLLFDYTRSEFITNCFLRLPEPVENLRRGIFMKYFPVVNTIAMASILAWMIVAQH